MHLRGFHLKEISRPSGVPNIPISLPDSDPQLPEITWRILVKNGLKGKDRREDLGEQNAATPVIDVITRPVVFSVMENVEIFHEKGWVCAGKC